MNRGQKLWKVFRKSLLKKYVKYNRIVSLDCNRLLQNEQNSLVIKGHWKKTARLIFLKVGQSSWKNPIRFMVKRKMGVVSHFWAHKMHVKMLIWLAQSQCYGTGRKKLIWGCQGSLLKSFWPQINNKMKIYVPRLNWENDILVRFSGWNLSRNVQFKL